MPHLTAFEPEFSDLPFVHNKDCQYQVSHLDYDNVVVNASIPLAGLYLHRDSMKTNLQQKEHIRYLLGYVQIVY